MPVGSVNRLQRRIHARCYDPIVGIGDRLFLDQLRTDLVSDLEGRVLDLGAGTGSSFPHLAGVSGITEVIAVEPDRYMRTRARQRALSTECPIALVAGIGEALPLADDSVDGAVVSLALCTVDDRETVRHELARVVAPGGEVRLLEHVRGAGWRGRAQRAIARPWRWVTGGCDLTGRQHDPYLEDPAFEVIEAKLYHVGLFPIKPFVVVRLRRVERSDDREE